MNGITVEMLEEALTDAGWDPEYKDVGDPLDLPSFEITVETRTLYIELIGPESDKPVSMVRICELDENEVEFTDVWDIEDLDEPNTVVREIKEFIETA